MKKFVSIGEAAKKLNVSIDTLRRWDKTGILKSYRLGGEKGHRYYEETDLALFGIDLLEEARNWATSQEPHEPENNFYCIDSSVFQARLGKLENRIKIIPGLEDEFSLITSSVGEIGNNSFDHNIGSWPDIRGIFFAYNLEKKQIILADRGRGILTTLKRVRPNLKTDEEALSLAFTEKISGRAPESRGNGLKYVKRAVTQDSNKISIKLFFQTGEAELFLEKGAGNLDIKKSKRPFRGCLALITF
ncbi:MAG: helix-turn-helix domain-containing protein [Patescibacteria group bacterium]